jgi:quercetin dioxygenase-like cupin family protein
MNGYLLRPGEGVRPDDLAAKATAGSTGGALSVIESHTTGGAPWHSHRFEDEAFYVLDGVLTVRCGDDTWEVDRGCFVYLPRGVSHSWDVNTLSASLLIITTPAGLDDFLREHHGVTDPAEQERISERYGIVWNR